MHMQLQMPFLDIKHSHTAETEPGVTSLEALLSLSFGERQNEKTNKQTKTLIALLWLHAGWKWGRNCKHSGGSFSKILQEICVGIKGLKLSEVNGKIEND